MIPTVDIVEAARRIYRALEMSAGIMRDPGRTGGWEGAERTASAFERQAIAAKSLHTRLAALASAPAGKLNRDFTARRIKELMDEGDGFWRACSGCQESCDGHVSERDYPFDPLFRCQPGGGCSECGGIGVLWDDGRGYDDITGDEEPASAPAGDGAEAATQMMRDCAHDLTSTASHHGQYAAIDQDKVDGLRDAVRDYDEALDRPRPAAGAWSFDMAAAPEGVDLLVYRHDGGAVPWVNGVRAVASKEDGEWYGADGDAITTPAAWTYLQSPPVKAGRVI